MIDDALTIGEVAARTGASVALLRAWERRYGFPRPGRDAAGRRVFDETTCRQIAEVLARRAEGLSVGSAIESVLARPPAYRPSLFATVRDGAPHLDPLLLGLRSMRALSHAIEDHCLARPDERVVLGAFQTAAHYDAVDARWRALADASTTAVAYADFPRAATAGSPARIPFDTASPLRREWAVVVHAHELSACLVGWERPPETRNSPARTFESVWSTDPAVVAIAANALAAVTAVHSDELAERVRAHLVTPVAATARAADDVTARAVRALGR